MHIRLHLRLSCSPTPAACRRSVVIKCFQPEGGQSPSNTVKILSTAIPTRTKDTGNSVLKHAEADLQSYCPNVTDDNEQLKCWRAYSYLRKKHRLLDEGCRAEKDGGLFRQKCGELNKLEELIKELEYEGDVESMYKTLALLDGIESRGKVETRALVSDHEVEQENDALRRRASALFSKISNQRTKIDVAQFREAMKQLSMELTGKEVGQILEAMDIHGFIDKEQFVDIVVAEKFRLLYPTSDAAFLTKVMHDTPARRTAESWFSIDNV